VAEDFYSVDEVARIMKLTPGRIRQMLRAGEVDGGVAAVRTEVKVKGVPEGHIFIAPRPASFCSTYNTKGTNLLRCATPQSRTGLWRDLPPRGIMRQLREAPHRGL
jgi:hypothetical protein